MSGTSGAFEEFSGGLESMYGGGIFDDFDLKTVAMAVGLVYLIWFLYANWAKFAPAGFQWNPFAANTEPMSAGLSASYGMATMPGGTGKYMVTGDSLNNSAGWLGTDYLDVSGRRGGSHEGMWTGKREGLSNIDVHKRDGMFGGNSAPAFWDPNPYLTQAKEWGVPDLSSDFQDGSANRVYWGQGDDQAQYRENLSQGQLLNQMNR